MFALILLVALCAANAVCDQFINGARGGFHAVRFRSQRAVDTQDRHMRILFEEPLTSWRDAEIAGAVRAVISVAGAGNVKLRLIRADRDENAVVGFLGHVMRAASALRIT